MKYIFVIFLYITLSSCNTYYIRGKMLDADYTGKLEKNMTTEEVVSILGQPSIVSDDKQKLYYISRKMHHATIAAPKLANQTTLIVEFADNKLINYTISYKDNIDINPVVKHRTNVSGANTSVVKDFVKNFGRFLPKNNKLKKRNIVS